MLSKHARETSASARRLSKLRPRPCLHKVHMILLRSEVAIPHADRASSLTTVCTTCRRMSRMWTSLPACCKSSRTHMPQQPRLNSLRRLLRILPQQTRGQCQQPPQHPLGKAHLHLSTRTRLHHPCSIQLSIAVMLHCPLQSQRPAPGRRPTWPLQSVHHQRQQTRLQRKRHLQRRPVLRLPALCSNWLQQLRQPQSHSRTRMST